MIIATPPPLQRDAMAWDSSHSTPKKNLSIQNIGKLIGQFTNYAPNGWVCMDVFDKQFTYELVFTSTDNTKPSMRIKVIIIKEAQYKNDYLIEIRVLTRDTHGMAWIPSPPHTYGANEGVFGHPKTFMNWIDGKLRQRRIEFDELLWKQTPWYNKFKTKVKSFIESI